MKQRALVLLIACCYVSVSHAMHQLIAAIGETVAVSKQCAVVPYCQLKTKPERGDFVIIRDETNLKDQYIWAQVVAIKKVLQSRNCVNHYTVVYKERADGVQMRTVYVLEKLYALREQQPLGEQKDPNAMDYHYQS